MDRPGPSQHPPKNFYRVLSGYCSDCRAASLFSPATLVPAKGYLCRQKLKSQPTAATRTLHRTAHRRRQSARLSQRDHIRPLFRRRRRSPPGKNPCTRRSARISRTNSPREAQWKPLSPRKSSTPPGVFAVARKRNPVSQHRARAQVSRHFHCATAELRRLQKERQIRTEAPSEQQPPRMLKTVATKQTQSEPPQTLSIPRGAPCPRGSGAKYKRCCGTNAPAVLSPAA